MAAPLILVVDDEPSVREAVRRALESEGYRVEQAADGDEALARTTALAPDLIILDVMMPGKDGLEVARLLRQQGSDAAILMLTARDEVEDRVSGLDAGADDYLIKPFDLDELFARVRALLRRAGSDGSERLVFADVAMDLSRREVHRGARLLELTRMEFSLLELFLRHPRQVLTRSVIFEHVWGYDFGATSNSLDVYIGYLRRKLEAGSEGRLIQTIRGIGYALKEPPQKGVVTPAPSPAPSASEA